MVRRSSAILALCIVLWLSGCTTRFGRMPDTSTLPQLQPGLSNKADVLRVLGPPRGYGAVRVASVQGRHVTWFYEYVQSNGRSADLKMLLIYFDGEAYEGHLWFSSLDKAEIRR